MADIGRLRSIASGIPDPTTKQIVIEICEEICGTKSGIAFGDPDHQRRATNFRAMYQTSTTATSTGEFSIAHGMETAPTMAIPVLDLGQPGSQWVPLEVVRAADSKRVYLKSASTRALFTVLME